MAHYQNIYNGGNGAPPVAQGRAQNDGLVR